jgi:hypothetical protein
MSSSRNPVPVQVFAGTAWEASLVKSLLENAEIEAYLKDPIMGTLATWIAAPGGADSVKVMVAEDDVDRAKLVVGDFELNKNIKE